MMKRAREESSCVEIDSMNIANALMLLSKESSMLYDQDRSDHERVFECKTCNRQFGSFQALGGHRASHKKPKILTGEEEGQKEEGTTKTKMHECSICGVEFKIGQALGGHMRRHRGTTGGFVEKKEGVKRIMLFGFDLTAVV